MRDSEIERLTVLAEAALARWPGSFSGLTLIKHRENAVFSVHDAQGSQLALRLHRQNYHGSAALRSELVWMCAVAAGGLKVPEPIASIDGSYCVTVDESGPLRRHADLLRWLPGTSLAVVEAEPDFDATRAAMFYRRIGATAALLHEHSRSWAAPAGFERPRWDSDGLVGVAPLWGRFWELAVLSESEAALVRKARQALIEDLALIGQERDMFGMIHGDMLADNIIIDHDTVKLIDFDDAGWGWYIFDLATILYFHMNSPLYEVMRTSLLAGYRSVRAFPEREEALLPVFLMARSLTYLGWVHTRSEAQTAREQTPMLVARCCDLAREYLAGRRQFLPTGRYNPHRTP